MKKYKLLCAAFSIFLIIQTTSIKPTAYGSDSTVSLVNAPDITGPDNIINSFAYLYRGFGFTDAATTCTFKSVFPVMDGINLNGGTLYLMSDLTMNNTSSFVDFGKINAQQHAINFSESFKYFAAPGTPSGTRKVLELISRITALSKINSADWSYDGNYVAITINNTNTYDLQIYYFDGKTLTIAASYNYGNATGYTVRWHPNSYFLATTTSNGAAKINLLQFTPPSTLTLHNSQNPTGTYYAVAWNGPGTRIAAGGTTLTSYNFNTGTNVFDTQITPTNAATLNGNILNNCLRWAPRGNKEDLIAVTNNAGTNGSIHLYNFTGAALNHLKNYTLGIAANCMDWARTSTYVAVGFADNTIKTYEHMASTNIITYKNNYTETSAVNSVSWTKDGTELAAGMAFSATGIEFDYFDFNSITYALSSKYTLDLTSAVNIVNWSPTVASYLIRADATTNYLSIYKPVYSSCAIKDAKIFLNSDLTLAAPLTFTGNCLIDARNHAIKFIGDGAIHLEKDSTLEIQLANLNFTQPTGIVLQGPTSNMIFKNSIIQLDSDVTWGDGRFQVYRDLTITGPHTFNYQTAYTSTINAFSRLNLENEAIFKLGKTKNTTIEPLVFASNTAELNLNNATLHTTGSGLKITKGIVNVYGTSDFIIDWTQTDPNDTKISSTNQGLVFGDGQKVSNDSMIFIHEGSLNLFGGGIIFDPFLTPSMVQFYGQSQLAVDSTTTIYLKKPISSTSGWINTNTTIKLIIDPNAYFSLEQTRISNPSSTFDYYLTGSHTNTTTIVLDQNDTVVINKGFLRRVVKVIKDGNSITGNGTLSGSINFTNSESELSWDLLSKITESDVYLNGGRIIINQDTGLTSNYSFKNTGSIDLTNHIFELGTEDTTWNGNLYWIGDGATLKFNNNVTLDGIWTFSGSVIIDGNSCLFDLGSTASIILERGAHVTFKNISLKNLSRKNRITCLDNNCQIKLNQADILLGGDYLFEKGAIFVYYNSNISLIDGLDGLYTLSYASTQTSTIDSFCNLTISNGIRFAIGRQNGLITNPNKQPLVFLDPATSTLIMDGGTFHITSSGMILTKGTLQISNSSNLEIENSTYPYGLILGDETSSNDFRLKLEPGVKFTLKSGKLFYNNFSNNRIIFDSPESNFAIEQTAGLTLLKNIILSQGTVSTPYSILTPIGVTENVIFFADNVHRYDYKHILDYYLTATVENLPEQIVPNLILDSDCSLLINPGNFDRNISINHTGNEISGIGNISGIINFTDFQSTLSWNIPQTYSGGNIDLKGGRIIYTQNSGISPQYSFVGTGTIDITDKTFQLGTEATTWNGDLYWTGSGGMIVLNNNVTIDGTWTLSGNIEIDGNSYLIDFAPTGSIILERGAHVSFKNISLYHLSRQHGITCSDNNCQLTLNQAGILLSNDYLFEKGSILASRDSSIGLVDGLDNIYTFSYASTQTSTIDAFCELKISKGVRFSIGRLNSTITNPKMQPIIFSNPATSKLILNGGTLHITSSGMLMTRGILNVTNSSFIETENAIYPYGIILGDGTKENDFELNLNAGTRLTLNSGRIFYNNYADDRIVFGSQESSVNIVSNKGLYPTKNLLLKNGTMTSPNAYDVPPGYNPNAYVIGSNLHRYDSAHIIDYYVTGTLVAEPARTFILDSNDKLLVNPGDLSVNILVKKSGNYLTGIGNIRGNIQLTDWRSSLTWDIPRLYTTDNINLNGGKIIYTQDSGIGPQYSFIGTGTIDLTNKTFQLGTEAATWTGDLYWTGSGGRLILNNNVTIDGTWTLSGNIEIDGNSYLIDLAPTGSLILERGAQITLKNISMHDLSRKNRITCLDNNCKITLNEADLLISGDYLWDKGSIFTYYDSNIGIIDKLDSTFTFSYESSQTSTIDFFATLNILSNTILSIGRQNSTITNPEQQPLVFIDPATSKLILEGGSLHVTSSGMIMTKGSLVANDRSTIEIENSQEAYALTIGDMTAKNDFAIEIDPGAQLTMNYGRVFYKNYSPNRIIFDSPASSIITRGSETKEDGGFFAKTNITLKNGTLETANESNIAIAKDANIEPVQDNITRIYRSPYSVQNITVHALRPYKLINNDYCYITEGYTTNEVIADTGTSNFGGTGIFDGALTLKNHTVTLQSSLETPFFNNVTLNGGTFIAKSNNSFATDKTLTGSGTIQLPGTTISFGPMDSKQTNTIYWQASNSGGINLNSQTDLYGNWMFDSTFVLNGNGNILDMASGGILTIRPNSTLSLENIFLKGLGSGFGKINFMDDTATLRLTNVYIELDNNLSTTIGSIVVNGPTIVGLKNFNWTLDQNASMTVDGTTLWQDPLDKINPGKIQFGSGSINKYLTLVSSGTIKTQTNLDIVTTNTTELQEQVKNNSNAITFQSDHFRVVNDGKITALGAITGSINVEGLGLLSSPIDLNGGTLTLGSDMIFSNQTVVNSSGNFDLQDNAIILGGDLELPANTTIKIISSGVIDGQGHFLELSDGARLIVDNNVTLTLRNMTWMSRQSNWPIEMQTKSSKLACQNSALCFDRDLTITQGQLFIHGDVFITGTNKFSYASTETSYIAPHSTLYFDTNSTFSYSPRLTNRHTQSEKNLIKLIDKTSSIFFDECSLQLPDSGWKLTTGTIYFNNKVKIYGPITQENSFEVGSKITNEDLDINILSGANIENYGYVHYNNVS